MRSESKDRRPVTSGTGRETPVYTVAQVNAYIQNIFLRDYALRRICVKGEVSNCKYHTSGHIYFTLKDATGTLAAVMFAGDRSGLSFVMREGQRVVVTGTVRLYERDSRVELYAKEIRPDGLGDLYLELEERKARLAEMGMFAPEYKQPIPAFAQKIGVVTAVTGAAIHDIVTVAHRRNPYVQLILYPAIVQGEQAADSVVRGIETLDAMNLDCLIVGRGGGSIEDLRAFNEERVARAIFDCHTPVISAVGHETDTTIADYAADLRAPTPSAAAELAVYSVTDFLDSLRTARQRLGRTMKGELSKQKLAVEQADRRLERMTPRSGIEEKRQSVREIGHRLDEILQEHLESCRQELSLAAARLEALSPLTRMKSGYAFVVTEDGRALRSVDQTSEGEHLTVTVQDGQIRARVESAVRRKEE